jgi:LacI family transcriptional regulator
VEDVALAAGYDVILCNTSYNLKRGTKFIKSLVDKHIDGVMLMCSGSDELVLALANHRIPAVVLEWPIDMVEGMVGVVAVDFETGIRAAVDHLIDLGHRRLAHVSGPLGRRTARVRRDAFMKSVAAQGVDPARVPVIEGGFCVRGGRRALAELLSTTTERPTAIFAANDLMALGVLWAAHEAGLQVPGDLSVIGLDDIELAAEVSPPLTTVALPQHEIGEAAMRMLLELISLPHGAPAEVVHHDTVSTHLVPRQSTAQPRACRSVP